jgi:hypothetical protein
MKILWYVLTAFFGLIGTLGMLRTVELLAIGAALVPTQVFIAVAMLVLAFVCLRKARTTK